MKPTCILWMLLLTAIEAPGQTVRTTISTMDIPNSIAVNSVTNKVYLTNPGTGSLTVVNGIADLAGQMLVGQSPTAVAVNATTDRIYVSNGDATVSILDGTFAGASDKLLATVNVQGTPGPIAVNAVTNKVYVAIPAANMVAVIDGATNGVAYVSTGLLPSAIAVNPVTNRIYVANTTGNNVTVIDGATNSAATVPTASLPTAIAVNVATNKIYVAAFSASITVIDGTNNSPSSITSVPGGAAIAVNPITNKVYVAAGGKVVLLDGATNNLTTMAAPFVTKTVAVNPTTNQIYVAGAAGANSNPRINFWVIDGATNTVTPLGTANNTTLMAVNPASNRVYLAANTTTGVTDLDGAVNRTLSVPLDHVAGSAADPVTNRIYAINLLAHTVSVVDGATTVLLGTVPLAAQPMSLVLNPITGKVYVLSANNTVTVVDEATLGVSVVPVGDQGGNTASPAHAIAINPITNRIYVANHGSNSMSVIDGATNTVSTVNTNMGPLAVGVNPTTNRVYVVNGGSGSVTVIDGQTNAVLQTVTVGSQPDAIAVNPNANQILVTNAGTNDLSVIDGATNATSTIPLGGSPGDVVVDPLTGRGFAAVAPLGIVAVDVQTPGTAVIPMSGTVNFALALDPATHKIYSIDLSTGMVSIVDGLSGTAASTVAGAVPIHIAVNPATNTVYVSSRLALVVIQGAAPQPNPLSVSATPLLLNQTATPAPQFPVTAADGFGAPVQGIYYQVDQRVSGWLPAAMTGPGQFSARPTLLAPGLHVLYTLSTDGQDSTSTNTGAESSPLISNISGTAFLVLPAGTPVLQSVSISPPSSSLVVGYPAQLTAMGTFSDGSMRAISGEVSWNSSNTAAALSDQSGAAIGIAPGAAIFTASFGPLNASTAVTTVSPSYSVTAVPAGPVTISGTDYVFNIKITNSGNVPVSGVSLASILLNSTAITSTKPAIASLAPGASSTFSFTSPGAAGAHGSTATLRVAGAYNVILPGGASQSQNFSTGARVALP